MNIGYWTEEEMNILTSCYSTHSMEQLVQKIPGRSRNAIMKKASRLLIRKYITMDEMISYIHRHPGMKLRTYAHHLGCSVSKIKKAIHYAESKSIHQ